MKRFLLAPVAILAACAAPPSSPASLTPAPTAISTVVVTPAPTATPAASSTPGVTRVAVHLAGLTGLPPDADRNPRWSGTTYHVHSAAGLQALAKRWGSAPLVTDADFAREDLWVSLQQDSQGCKPPALSALSSDGRTLAPVFGTLDCPTPVPERSPGTVHAVAYAFTRQNLPISSAIDPETPTTSYQAVARHSWRSPPADSQYPRLAITPDGTFCVVVPPHHGELYRMKLDGTTLPPLSLPGGAEDLAVAPSGDLWVAGTPCSRIDAAGNVHPLTFGRYGYDGIAVDGQNRVWVERLDVESMIPLAIYSDTGSPSAAAPTDSAMASNLMRSLEGSIWGAIGSKVVEFDDRAGIKAQATLPGSIQAFTLGPDGHWWTLYEGQHLLESDPTGRPLGDHPLNDVPALGSLAFDLQGRLWAIARDASEVIELGP